MYKIYSRPRIKIPKFNMNNKNSMNMKDKDLEKIVKIIVVLLIAFGTLRIIINAVNPIFDTLCESKAKSMATIITNEQAKNIIKEYSYDDIFITEKDVNGNITMIRSNMISINKIISDVAINIQKEIDSQGRGNIKIALGSFTGFKLIAGRGPGVNVVFAPIGNVETDLKSEFISQGINQTLHQVYLDVECEINILTPFKDTSRKISNKVILIENVIVGTIPNTYYNIEGVKTKRDVMELIE